MYMFNRVNGILSTMAEKGFLQSNINYHGRIRIRIFLWKFWIRISDTDYYAKFSMIFSPRFAKKINGEKFLLNLIF